jgi:hypothetical protein
MNCPKPPLEPPPTDMSDPRSNPGGGVAGITDAGAPAAMPCVRRRSQIKLLRKTVNAMIRPTDVSV